MKKTVFMILAGGVIFLSSCKKDGTASDGSAPLQVRMTDAPANVDEVNVDVQSVRVKYNDDPSDSTLDWVDLSTNAGIYNLLGFQNGVDTVIATGTLPQRSVKEIRLILGSANTVKVSGVVYPLTIPSGSESGLKIKFSKSLNATLNTLVIDFDAGLSIQQNGTGGYFLKPVLRVH